MTGQKMQSDTPSKPSRAQTWDFAAAASDNASFVAHQKSAQLNNGELFKAKQEEIDHVRARQDAQQLFEQHQIIFEDSRDKLLVAIAKASSLLGDLRDFNKNKRLIHYAAAATNTHMPAHRRSNSNKSALNLEGTTAEQDTPKRSAPPALTRFHTTQGRAAASLPNTPDRNMDTSWGSGDDSASDMSVLALDLRVGSVASDPLALVRSLENSSVAQLLDGRMEKSERHLENLKQRLTDNQSKVLVTGDLNAGKSTLINALLRRSVMPTDQQPCTTVFCEVLDASEYNQGVEEVHVLKPSVQYRAADDSTFTRHSLSDIEQIVADAEENSPEDAPLLKCYAYDLRAAQDSLLKNGLVDIALIDAPGLNRDSLKTTALFARQEEIDVVVFVVNAENHFTLSAKEFLWNASHDKAYVFVVVNKFDQIKNKDKCRKLVLDQIRQLSPRTYDDAANLVHFVDSQAVFGGEDVTAPDTPSEEHMKVRGVELPSDSLSAFARLEAALRDFVLLKRAKSKLLPSKTYMLRLLSDVVHLANINTEVARIELSEALKALEVARPALAKCQASQQKLETVVEGEEDEAVTSVMQQASRKLQTAVDLIGNGKSAVSTVSLPAYPGLFSVWEYAQDVRHALTTSLEMAMRTVEDSARGTTSTAVDRVQQLGQVHLPDQDSEKRQRIFNSDAMFAKRRAMTGLVGLNLGAEVVQVQASDFFDAYHHFAFASGQSEKAKGDSKADEVSLVSSLSLGVGALTLVGGKGFGVKSAIDSLVRVSDLVGNPTARKWAGPAFAIISTGLIVYFIYDLPNSIPRNIGRRMKLGLDNGALMRSSKALTTVTSGNNAEDASFAAFHSTRVGRETRKVLRLASWDLQERFRVAISQRRAEVERQEAKQESANLALKWFDETTGRVTVIRTAVDEVKGLEA